MVFVIEKRAHVNECKTCRGKFSEKALQENSTFDLFSQLNKAKYDEYAERMCLTWWIIEALGHDVSV